MLLQTPLFSRWSLPLSTGTGTEEQVTFKSNFSAVRLWQSLIRIQIRFGGSALIWLPGSGSVSTSRKSEGSWYLPYRIETRAGSETKEKLGIFSVTWILHCNHSVLDSELNPRRLFRILRAQILVPQLRNGWTGALFLLCTGAVYYVL